MGWGLGDQVQNNLARNCMKCADPHRRITFLTIHSHRGEGQLKQIIFARNYMKYANLYGKSYF